MHRVGQRHRERRRPGHVHVEALQLAAVLLAVHPVQHRAHVPRGGVRVHAHLDHRVVGIRQRPQPEGAHGAVRLQQDLVVEGGVVHGRHAQGRVLLSDLVGAGPHRIVESLLLLLGRLAGGLGRVLGRLALLAADVEGPPRDLVGEGVDQRPGPVHALDAVYGGQLALHAGQPHHVLGRQQLLAGLRLQLDHHRVGAEVAGIDGLVPVRRRAGVGQQADAGVGVEAGGAVAEQGADQQAREQDAERHTRRLQGRHLRCRRGPAARLFGCHSPPDVHVVPYCPGDPDISRFTSCWSDEVLLGEALPPPLDPPAQEKPPA